MFDIKHLSNMNPLSYTFLSASSVGCIGCSVSQATQAKEAIFSPLSNLIAVDSSVLTLACFISVGCLAIAVLIYLMGFPCRQCPRCAERGIET